jgi:hypothetical protein
MLGPSCEGGRVDVCSGQGVDTEAATCSACVQERCAEHTLPLARLPAFFRIYASTHPRFYFFCPGCLGAGAYHAMHS